MATTAVFVELLIVGLQTSAWLLLLVLTFAPPEFDLVALERWAGLASVAALSIVYVVGIVADRVADSFYSWFQMTRVGRLANRRFGLGVDGRGLPDSVGRMRLTVMNESPGMTAFLEYQRSRLRIARATFANLGPATLGAALYVALATGPCVTAILAVVLLGAGLLGMSLFAAERIHASYIKRLLDAYAITTNRRGA